MMDPPTLETNDPSKMISSLGSKLIPTNATEIKLLQTLDTKYQLQSTQERIFSLNEKLKKITLSSSSSNSIGTKEEVNKDWTKTYEKWDQFIDRDEVIELKKKEEQDYESLLAKADNLGHVHNHTEEREFFQQPEHQKSEVCKGYRTLGNYFVYEGSFSEAIEAYETSIGYYEYCFPEEEENQKELDDIRVACFLNVSMCYLRVKEFRKAIESASNAIRETKELNPKAFYRRGQAYRCLDDYENAKTDLEKALKIVPKDKMILEELKLLKTLEEEAKRKKSQFAASMFDSNSSKEEENKDNSSDIEKFEEELYEEFVKRDLPDEYNPEKTLFFPSIPQSVTTLYRYIEEYIDEDILSRC